MSFPHLLGGKTTKKQRRAVIIIKKVLEYLKEFLKGLDKFLLIICVCAASLSVVCLYSLYSSGQIGSIRTVLIQALAAFLGTVCALVISVIDYKTLAKAWKIHMPIAVLLVVLTFFIGVGGLEGADDKAWLDLGITTIQPAEILKISFILTFALHLSTVKDDINHIRPFLLLCLHGAVPVVLVMLQGDYGTALIFVAIFIFMMFGAGLSIKWIFVGIGAACAGLPMVWFLLLPDYLRERFFVAWHPENYLTGSQRGLQQYMGRIALGSGGLLGRGMFSDNIYYVPAAESDFILSYIGQIFGFAGTVITLLLIALLCVKILVTSKTAKDPLGAYICIGVFAMFLLQTLLNVGMVLCVLPVIGVTLPFISAGGTSIAVSFLAIGMVCSVYRHNKKDFMFD